jgi:hypothetical protein
MNEDKGYICNISSNELEKALYKNSFETLEEIKENEECVVIRPYHCENYHILLIDEFIKSNIKGDYINPYNRNKIVFSDEDKIVLENKRQIYISTLKNKPHELFEKFTHILDKIKETNTEIFLFPDIAKTLNILLQILPFFENLEEALGHYDQDIEKIVRELEERIQKILDELLKEVNDSNTVNKFLEKTLFMTIPIEIQNNLKFLFSDFLNIIHQLTEKKMEFSFKDQIVNIFNLMDDVHMMFCYESDVILKNENIESKIFSLLCYIDELINQLKNDIH